MRAQVCPTSSLSIPLTTSLTGFSTTIFIFLRFDIEKEIEELEKMNGTKEKMPDYKEEISVDDFDKVDLRTGKIIECKKHPKADKLLVSQVKIGGDVRQIVSGIAMHYSPEDMVGKSVVVVANLKPVKLRGELSQGMLLFADNGEKLEIVTSEAEDGNQIR